jgi:hypothetical protein
MGLRELEKKIKLQDEMKKKAAEYQMQELQNKAELQTMTKEKLAEIAKKHGVIIALDDKLKEDVDKLRSEYGIKEGNIIREILTEESVLKKDKVDIEKLGMFAYQRVMMRKDETGGLFLLSDVYELVNTGALKDKAKITVDDVDKAIRLLKKKNVIPEIREMEGGVVIVSFFPVQYTSDQSDVLKFVANKGFCTLAEVCAGLKWSEDRSLRALQNLEATRIAKVDESLRTGKKWYFPGLNKK